MLTIAHADRSRSTLKDDKRFRNGLVCDLKEKLKMNQIISIQFQTISIQSQTISHKNSCINISMNSTMKCISNCLNTNNIEDKRTGKYYAGLTLTEESQENFIHAVLQSFKSIDQVTLIIVICIIFACICWFAYCNVTKDIQNKVGVIHLIKEFIISTSVCILYSYILPNIKLEHDVSVDNINLDSSVNVTVNKESQSVSVSTTKDCRSRYAKFLHDKRVFILTVTVKRHVGRRDREPSRIPAKKLSRLLKKNRKLRKLVRKHIRKNVPRTSRIHRLLCASSRERKRLLSDQVRYLPRVIKKTKCVQERRSRKQTAASKTSAFRFERSKNRCKFSTKPLEQSQNYSEAATYKNLNHRMNCCKFNLSRDIEENPGPVYIDPSKTIHAPYSQGNVDIFGLNAGQQCVAMSLCALIHNFRNKSVTCTISHPEHLVQIMNLGNELYSVLSRLSRQSYLLLTELPSMVTVLNTNYQLEFSDSYSGNLHAATLNENIPNVMPLDSALQCLLLESYNSFLLTIGCNTVSVYTLPNGLLKIFDSHARDSFGMSHSHGTCVLLEVNSINNLVEYFKNLHRRDVLFELKGIKITVVQFTCTPITNLNTNTCELSLSPVHQHVIMRHLMTNLLLDNVVPYPSMLFAFLLLQHVVTGIIRH